VQGSTRSYGSALAVISAVFFMWGFVTVLNDILVPHLKAILALNYTETMLIQFTFFSAHFLMSMPAAKVPLRSDDTVVSPEGQGVPGEQCGEVGVVIVRC
jgi:MFS transporter, FHS family, L-fucose permease